MSKPLTTKIAPPRLASPFALQLDPNSSGGALHPSSTSVLHLNRVADGVEDRPQRGCRRVGSGPEVTCFSFEYPRRPARILGRPPSFAGHPRSREHPRSGEFRRDLPSVRAPGALTAANSGEPRPLSFLALSERRTSADSPSTWPRRVSLYQWSASPPDTTMDPRDTPPARLTPDPAIVGQWNGSCPRGGGS
jgi:hypothetical protein